MVDKFAQHFLMTTLDIEQYIKEKLNYFTEDSVLTTQEIGDGNINYVFKIKDEKSGKSLVIKQADTKLRSSGRPLGLQHNKIEADALAIQGKLAPKFVPKVYLYDKDMCTIVMEDISGYKNLRQELLEGKSFAHLAESISEFMAKTLLATSDLTLDRAEKKQNVAAFINTELCDISEDLVFTEPYFDYKKRNIISEENLEFVKKQLYGDLALKAEVGILRNNFMNNAQVLLHGDLHSGSIFINDEGIKVIDPEFAFYGPMGYDIGNVLGNLFFAHARNYFFTSDVDFSIWTKKTIEDIFDLFFAKLQKEFDDTVTFDLYSNQSFKAQYIKSIMSDSVGYAGTELIRRVVGDSKVAEIITAKGGKAKLAMEQSLVLLGKSFINKRREITKGSQLTAEFGQIIKGL